jgi:hypothetical protein
VYPIYGAPRLNDITYSVIQIILSINGSIQNVN